MSNDQWSLRALLSFANLLFFFQERKCKQECGFSHIHDSDLNAEQVKCVRLCASVKCYNELYAWNELEPGEVDVRYTSFKGCASKDLKEQAAKDDL